MESAMSSMSMATSTTSLFTISKALNRGATSTTKSALTHCLTTSRLVERRLSRIYGLPRSVSSSSFLSPRISFAAEKLPLRRRFAAYFSSGGGNDGHGGSGDGEGGGSGSEGGDSKAKLASGGAEEGSAAAADVIILDVTGMTCGGCAASVKRILESQPQVSSASVNLTTETAVVWPVAEAKVVPNWQQQLGEELAKQLTNCGFKSNLRGEGEAAIEGDISL